MSMSRPVDQCNNTIEVYRYTSMVIPKAKAKLVLPFGNTNLTNYSKASSSMN